MSVDEKTGIQALEPKQQTGRCGRDESSGASRVLSTATQTPLAGFNVATGLVMESIGEVRTKVGFAWYGAPYPLSEGGGPPKKIYAKASWSFLMGEKLWDALVCEDHGSRHHGTGI